MATITQVYKKDLAVAINASGDNIVIPAVAGQVIDIHALHLTCASAVDITPKDGASVSLGKFQQRTELILDAQPNLKDRYRLTPGNAFILNLGSAVSVTGTIWYSQRVAP